MVHSFFRFYGTNAYWLQMATDADMDLTFHDIATANFRVVRTWAFNDVLSKPSSGPYFQVMLSCLFFLFHSV
jgi:mannan endo-1,4-beta-mannosidase